MRDNSVFNDAVERFLDTLRGGDNIEFTWAELASEGMNVADLQRALQRAEQLEAEEDSEGW